MKKQMLRMGTDIGMTVFLLLAFGYQLTGSFAHEIIGIGTFILMLLCMLFVLISGLFDYNILILTSEIYRWYTK